MIYPTFQNEPMSDFSLLFKGFGFGIMVSAPIGPLGVLCIQRTLSKGFRSGFISGFGAATADIFYAAIAGFGINLIANVIQNQQSTIRLIGGIILILLGLIIYIKPQTRLSSPYQQTRVSYLSDFLSSFLITVTNPLTVIIFGIAFTHVGLDAVSSHQSIGLMLIGVFFGAVSWWFFLTILTKCIKGKLTDQLLKRIYQSTGVFISCSGLIVVVYQLFKILS